MTQYLAHINVPGYLPDTMEDPPVFDTAQEAWQYLAEQRETAEDDHMDWPPLDPDQPELGGTTEYTETLAHLRNLGESTFTSPSPGWWEDHGVGPDGTGSVVGETPGYFGDHDLGMAYTVTALTADEDFVAKLEAHDADTRTEFGQPVHYSSPEDREHMDDMLALPIQTNRDADTFTRSNWRVIQKDLTDRFPDDIEDHRFGHWAVGWIERLYVRRGADVAIAAAQKWVEGLEDYPVADDSDLSEIENEEINQSIGDYLSSSFALNVGDYGEGEELEAVRDLWSDFGYPERETILRYLFRHDEQLRHYTPDHDGTDVNWDTFLIEDVVTDWLLWVLDTEQRPHPGQDDRNPLPGQDPIVGWKTDLADHEREQHNRETEHWMHSHPREGTRK